MKPQTKSIMLTILALCLLGAGGWAAHRKYRAGWVPPGFATPERFQYDFSLTDRNNDPWLPYDPHILIPLRAAPWEDLDQKLLNLDERAQAVSGYDSVWVGGEIIQPLFTWVFPKARMYVVMSSIPNGDMAGMPAPEFLMVTFKGKDYRMFQDLDAFLMDAGCTAQDLESVQMRQAIATTRLEPWEVFHPVTCDNGRAVYREYEYDPPDVYEMQCELDFHDRSVLAVFSEFDFQSPSSNFVHIYKERQGGKEYTPQDAQPHGLRMIPSPSPRNEIGMKA